MDINFGCLERRTVASELAARAFDSSLFLIDGGEHDRYQIVMIDEYMLPVRTRETYDDACPGPVKLEIHPYPLLGKIESAILRHLKTAAIINRSPSTTLEVRLYVAPSDDSTHILTIDCSEFVEDSFHLTYTKLRNFLAQRERGQALLSLGWVMAHAVKEVDPSREKITSEAFSKKCWTKEILSFAKKIIFEMNDFNREAGKLKQHQIEVTRMDLMQCATKVVKSAHPEISAEAAEKVAILFPLS